jgi:hypothetical protein
MTVHVYVNSVAKRTETQALLDSGATENFMSEDFTRSARLPFNPLPEARKVYNVDETPNKNGKITHFTDLEIRTGSERRNQHFFLTNLEEQKVILGYPWFATVQPKINWAKGWLNYSHLPIIFRTTDTKLAIRNAVAHVRHIMAPAGKRQTMASQLAEQAQPMHVNPLPNEYKRHAKVFSEEEAQHFSGPRIWDHTIDLRKDAPATLNAKVYALTQPERKAQSDFIKEMLAKRYIVPSISPYSSSFFFIKKKDGKLRPVQDYRKLNEWTIKN